MGLNAGFKASRVARGLVSQAFCSCDARNSSRVSIKLAYAACVSKTRARVRRSSSRWNCDLRAITRLRASFSSKPVTAARVGAPRNVPLRFFSSALRRFHSPSHKAALWFASYASVPSCSGGGGAAYRKSSLRAATSSASFKSRRRSPDAVRGLIGSSSSSTFTEAAFWFTGRRAMRAASSASRNLRLARWNSSV